MNNNNLSTLSLLWAFVPLVISLGVLGWLRIHRYQAFFLSFGRMSIQLWLLGLYLGYLFAWNHPLITMAYLLMMLMVANVSIIRGSGLRITLFKYTLPGVLLGIGLTSVYFAWFVFKLDPIYNARYLIPLTGMLLGNSINRTIVTLERFYGALRKDREGHAALVTMGAARLEAVIPYFRAAYQAGFEPMVANTATIGLVSLPGMMTGQILGGASPQTAVKYQIAIVLAITVATEIATLLTMYFSLSRGLDEYGFLREDIFKPF